MKRSKLILALIAAAVFGPSLALAQPSGPKAKHDLSLTHAQQSEIWRALGKSADKAQEPAGLSVGEVVPDTMNVLPFSRHLRAKVRAIGHYRYALMHDRVLIVDPETKKIIAIVGR
jgi:hypothetical protein